MTTDRSSLHSGGSDTRRWHKRIDELVRDKQDHGVSRADLCKLLNVSVRTLDRWRTGPMVPDPPKRKLVEQVLGYSFDAQLEDLGLAEGRRDWSEVRGQPSPTWLLNELRTLLDAAVANRPDILDLVRAVLTPADKAFRDVGRWRALVFDIAAGVDYPHTMFRAAEFRLGMKQDKNRHQPLPLDRWADLGVDDPMSLLNDRLRGLLETPPRIVFDTYDRQALGADVALARMELCYLLRDALTLATMRWYGESGALHRNLFPEPGAHRNRHLLIVPAYNERRPDAADVQTASWLADDGQAGRGLLLVAPTAALGNHVANVVGEALAWRTSTVGERVVRVSGRAAGYEDKQRPDRFRHAYEHLAERGIAGEIVVVNELDTVLDANGVVRSEFRAVLDHPLIATIVMTSAANTLQAWRRRQQDQVGLVEEPPGSGTLKPRSVSDANLPEVVQAAIGQIIEYLKNDQDISRRWAVVAQPNDAHLPWWGSGSKQYFVHPEIGDAVVRTAAALVYYLQHGRTPPRSLRSRKRTAVAPRSLLSRFVASLATDPHVASALTEVSASLPPRRG